MNVGDGDEVIVIGTGPCGAMAAATLNSRGVPVVMLDAGDRAPSGALLRVRGRTLVRKKDPSQLSEHRHDSPSDPAVHWASSLSLGGLSNYWTTAVPRFAPEDFTDGGRIDRRFLWPVTYDDLSPHYRVVEAELGLTSGDPIHGVPSGHALFDARLPKDWRNLARTAQAAGYGVGAVPMARGRPTMLARRGTEYVSYQCTVAPLLRSPNFRVVAGAFVMRLNWNPQTGRVDSVDYVDRATGERRQIRGRAVVLAAGTIDSTAIVLRSTSTDFPDGLGNSTGLVGRYLHDHPRQWWMFNSDVPLTALTHPIYVARDPHDTSEPLSGFSMTIGQTPRAADMLRAYVRRPVSRFGVQVLGTMTPTDELGVRIGELDGVRPEIRLRYDDAAARNMARAPVRLVELLRTAGIGTTVIEPDAPLIPGQSVHLAGTIRMHDDPEFGVLDRWNRMYEVPNVTVVDASSFPTGPEKNPTLTSMALAARAADRLATDLADEGPA